MQNNQLGRARAKGAWRRAAHTATRATCPIGPRRWMASLFGRAADALLPQADVCFADICDELRELRAENDRLRAKLGDDEAAASDDGSGAPKQHMRSALPEMGHAQGDQPGALAAVDPDGFATLTHDLAHNLGTDVAQAEAAQAAGLAEQLATMGRHIDAMHATHAATMQIVLGALADADADVECADVACASELALARTAAEEVAAVLTRRAERVEAAAAAQLAHARAEAAARVGALEEQLVAMQEAAASRDALLDDDDADSANSSALGAERALRVEWMARAQVSEEEAARLRAAAAAASDARAAAEARAEQASEAAAEAMRDCAARLERAAASEAAASARAAAEGEAAGAHAARAASVSDALSRLEARQSEMVDKREARSWLVNFVENPPRRDELLRLLAEWWDFSPEDRLRVGLLDAPPPHAPPAARRGDSLVSAFATFLEAEAGGEQ